MNWLTRLTIKTKIMSEKTAIEGNRLIAEFMGYDVVRYDQDWNELMPVVEKIESMPDMFVIIYGQDFENMKECEINNIHWRENQVIKVKSTFKIEATFKAVIQFIE